MMATNSDRDGHNVFLKMANSSHIWRFLKSTPLALHVCCGRHGIPYGHHGLWLPLNYAMAMSAVGVIF